MYATDPITFLKTVFHKQRTASKTISTNIILFLFPSDEAKELLLTCPSAFVGPILTKAHGSTGYDYACASVYVTVTCLCKQAFAGLSYWRQPESLDSLQKPQVSYRPSHANTAEAFPQPCGLAVKKRNGRRYEYYNTAIRRLFPELKNAIRHSKFCSLKQTTRVSRN